MPLRLCPLTSTMVLVLAAFALPASRGQAPSTATDKPPAKSGPAAPEFTSFDVASIREHKADDYNSSWQTKPNGVSMSNMRLDNLLSSAYKVKQYLISGGPSWINSKGWDIEAKVLPPDDGSPVKLTEAQQRVLLRALLAERFHVKAHVETKTAPVYDLVVAKSGPRMQVAPPPPPNPDAKPGDDDNNGSMFMNDGHMEVKNFAMSGFVENLSYIVQRNVIDRTGLTGKYNFTLDFTPEQEAQSASNAEAAGTQAHPPIFTALQDQLGLKLVGTKGPVDTLVVESAELPTAN